jgi:L-lactate dehydrogenase complex protein LldG
MSDARTEMLSRIRGALGSSTPEPAEVPRAYRSAGEHAAGSAEVLEVLVDRLVDYKAHVHQVAAADLPGLLAGLLAPGEPEADPERSAGSAERSARSVVVPPGIEPGWLARLADVEVFADSREAPLSATELDGIDAVVTAARAAVAETGTIVLDGEPDQGRRAISLVPDVHVCVVRTDQVVQTVPEAVRLLDADPGRPLTWISGPSATSDIELDRVEGVHGPRTLHVALVS